MTYYHYNLIGHWLHLHSCISYEYYYYRSYKLNSCINHEYYYHKSCNWIWPTRIRLNVPVIHGVVIVPTLL